MTHILLEGTPPQVDVALLERRLAEIPGVAGVHDLHVWTITSGLDAMSGHLVVPEAGDAARVLRQARQLLAEEFKVDHVTIQIEDVALQSEEKVLHV